MHVEVSMCKCAERIRAHKTRPCLSTGLKMGSASALPVAGLTGGLRRQNSIQSRMRLF